ncbi:WW domain-binding protein 4 isoform X3 [Diprion similis]|nr:WW domain-binding protein 4 isoform X3 [Diprion similis]
METAAMAAYLKDVENNTTDLTAERIIREKLANAGKSDTAPTNVPKAPQLAPPEANPRYNNRQFHPTVRDTQTRGNKGNRGERQFDIDPCDPSSSSQPRSSSHKAGLPGASGDSKAQGKAKIKGKRGKKGSEDDATKVRSQVFAQKLWYEAVSPEGYTYYWHIQTNESVWEPPAEGFATIAEQEEEAKELALQEELLAQIAKDEEKKKEETAEERRANTEREKYKEIRKQREEQEHAVEADDDEDLQSPSVPYRRDYSVPERPQPYGTWKTVQVIEKKPIDLQLPKHEFVAVSVPTLEREAPQRIFKEKTISRIDAGDSDEEIVPPTFKKRKFGNKNVRKRLDDD